MAQATEKTIRIKQVRSAIGLPEKQKEIVRCLGFKRLNQVLVRPDNAGIRGMVFHVRHLVEILENGNESK